ncbi:MAG TPA: hypothetical protein VGI39_35445 [Polyangiaceae bacterium]
MTGLVVAGQAGCQLQTSCGAPNGTYGNEDVVPGQLVDETTWESLNIDGTPWLELHALEGRWFDVAGAVGRPFELVDVVPYASPDPNPWDAMGGNFTVASGNIAEVTAGPAGAITGFWLFNNSCAQYYYRVVAHIHILGEGASDAGADAPTSPLDAGPNSPIDAAGDAQASFDGEASADAGAD